MDFSFFFRRIFHDDSYTRDSVDTNTEGHGSDDVSFVDSFERLNSPNEMFRKMEDMFNKIFVSSFGISDFSKYGETMPIENNPRNIMLKDSVDESISNSSKSECSCSLPKTFDSEMEPFEKFHNFSFSKFSSMKTVYLPDGTIEEHQTVIDSDGKKTTQVRRSIGEASHEVITKCDKQGLIEKEENFTNLDENKLLDFEKTWSNMKSNIDPQTDACSLNLSRPSYFNFLKKIFGSLQ